MRSSTGTAPVRWLTAGVVALGFAFCLGSAAQGAPVTFVFTGAVYRVPTGANLGIAVGMPVAGYFTFDDASPPDPNGCGAYSCIYPDAVTAFSVEVRQANFSLAENLLGAGTSEIDLGPVGLSRRNGFVVGAAGNTGGILLFLEDLSGAAFSSALPLVPPSLYAGKIHVHRGVAFSATLTSLTLAVSPTDYDGDGVLNTSDNCPIDVNPLQENADADLLGDVCDPFPNEADHAKAQCFVDLGTSNALLFQSQLDLAQSQQDLAQSQAGLAACQAQRVFADSDGDGEDNATDQCGSTPAGSPVDGDGCSVVQFCAPRAATCKRNDWMNDEPTSKKPGDCSYDKNLRSCR